MAYTMDRSFPGSRLDEIDRLTRAALSEAGFGVLTEIDVQATIKTKLGEDMRGYRILGACNPKMAHQALGIEPKVGAMLPCNVILRETDEGVEVCAIDPQASMSAVDNDELRGVAGQVREMLARVIDAIDVS